MVSLLSRNDNTRFCCFHIDSEDDLEKLPTHNTDGKDAVEVVKSCAYGSRATCANGKIYVLSGDNAWVAYQGSSGGSGGSSGSGNAEENIEPIPADMINGLFE